MGNPPLEAVRSKHLGARRIANDCFAFESRLEDVSFARDGSGWREVIHSIAIRGSLRVPDFVIDEIEAASEVMPYDMCRRTADVVGQLAGFRIGPGYRRAVLDLMGGTAGCTHFLTVALELSQLHTLIVYQQMREAVPNADRRDPEWMQAGVTIEPRLVNACATLVEDSPVITAARSLEPPQ